VLGVFGHSTVLGYKFYRSDNARARDREFRVKGQGFTVLTTRPPRRESSRTGAAYVDGYQPSSPSLTAVGVADGTCV